MLNAKKKVLYIYPSVQGTVKCWCLAAGLMYMHCVCNGCNRVFGQLSKYYYATNLFQFALAKAIYTT